jgi:DNA-binding MarR family transcriptional regulator
MSGTMRAMAAPRSAPPTPALAYELRETTGRLIRRLRAEPGPAMHVLTVLGHLDRQGPAGVSDLAAAQGMRPQSMAQTVREMEAAGLVTRRPDPGDGRRQLVELTGAGQELILASRAAREDWLAQALERELDDRERALLRDALALLARIAEA